MTLNGHAPLVGLSSGLAALIIAGITGYISLSDRQTQAQVEHLIELKTDDKYNEIIRRLTAIEDVVRENHLWYTPRYGK
jgi:hypothetical protein